jgi:hypothetical protein
MRRIALLHFVLFCLLASSMSAQPAGKPDFTSGPKLVGEFEGGKLYKTRKFNVLQLRGTFRQMGRQEGALLKEPISRFYDVAIANRMLKERGLPLDTIKAGAQHRFALYPERFKELLRGIAETSGMEADKLMLLSYVWSLALYATPGHCSAIAAWGDYTAGGPLVFGRNFDYPAYFKDFAEFLTVVVYNPPDAVPTASFGYAGQVSTINAMNQAGLFIEVNDGSLSGGSNSCTNRLAIAISTLGFLMDCRDMKGLDAVLNTTRSHYSYVYNVADSEAAYCYEMPLYDVKRRATDRPGLLVATNHFVDPSWGLAAPTRDVQSRSAQRYKNLLALADRYKGKLDERRMMEVLDIPFDKGGVTWPDRTIFQMVAVPKELRLWLKAPGYQEWVRVDLSELFAGEGRR